MTPAPAAPLPRDESAPQFTAHRLTGAELGPLLERADGPALVRAVWHLGVLALTGGLLVAYQATAWVIPLLVAHGYVLAFLFCPFHECAHRTAFRTRWLNAALGAIDRPRDLPAVRQLPRVPLGASPLHAGSRPRPRASFPQARVGRRVRPDIGGAALSAAAIRRHGRPGCRTGGQAVDGDSRAAPADRRGAGASRNLCHPGGGLGGRGLTPCSCSSGSCRSSSGRPSSSHTSLPSTPAAATRATASPTRAPR